MSRLIIILAGSLLEHLAIVPRLTYINSTNIEFVEGAFVIRGFCSIFYGKYFLAHEKVMKSSEMGESSESADSEVDQTSG